MSAFASKSYSKRPLARITTIVAAVATLAIATACSPDSISGPTATPPAASNNLLGGLVNGVGGLVNGVLSGLIPSKGLLRTTTLKKAVTVTQTIGRSGGTIELPTAGLKLTVPSGAITGNAITISVTALAGNTVAYEFQPHGTQFAKPLQFEQSLEGTTWNDLKVKATVVGGYFKALDQLNLLTGLGLLDETYPITVKSNRVMFDIHHFSGYMVSTGRSDASNDNAF